MIPEDVLKKRYSDDVKWVVSKTKRQRKKRFSVKPKGNIQSKTFYPFTQYILMHYNCITDWGR